MSRLISLTRIVAINWYGFRDIFEVGENMLISGAFGTGKSALLDLIQYVLLGGEKQFNRAAAGNARGRDLVGYCLGDTNQPGRDGGRHFFRRSGVTIAALEFTRPDERARGEAKRETWGIRLEFSSPDAKPSQTYFCIPDRIEYSDLNPDGKALLSEDAFRSWVRREYGNDCLFSLQREYLAEMAAPRHLNFDERAFQRTFPKAIAFEPENNVPEFIREFILEESPLDVRDVRSALRAYEDIRRRLEKQENEAGHLRRIAAQHLAYETSRRQEAFLQHTVKSLKLRQEETFRDRQQAELHQLEAGHAEDLKNLRQAQAESAETEKLLAEIRSQMDATDHNLHKMELDKTELQAHVQKLREARQSVQKRLDDRHYRWSQWLKHGASLSLEGLPEVLALDDRQLIQLRSGTDSERLASMVSLAQTFTDIRLALEKLVQPLETEIRSMENRLRQLAADLENLGQGRAPGAFPVFQAIREKLGPKAEQLGRLIEVRPEAERWWPSLELFLGRKRWVIVVDDQAAYRQALEILRRTPPGREQESLLNPTEVNSLKLDTRPDSLFAKIEINHCLARPYVEHLLGGVQCVESTEELESSPSSRAITPEGILKLAPLRQRLKPVESVQLTLGREGLKRMASTLHAEQIERRVGCDALKQRRGDIHAWLDNGIQGGLGDVTLPEHASEVSQLPENEVRLSRLHETIQLLATPEREAKQARIKELEVQKTKADNAVGRLVDSQQKFTIRTKPLREAIEAALEKIRECSLQLALDREELRLRFLNITDTELAEALEFLRREFPKWAECIEQSTLRSHEAGREAGEARYARNAERERLVNARDAKGQLLHPEYSGEFPINDENNDAWDARLRVLEEVELAKSRELAADRKREWERRLEENVLNELNSRLQEAQNTIRLLDRYLGKPVGRYRYRISQRRDNQAYAAIWSLLDSGLEPTDPLAAAIREGETQRAKEELMAAVNASAEGDERARRLLDYRNYHHYDIEMVPADRPDAPAISMTRSGRNLSGGENQAPFFISMLAAFRRVYDRGDRTSARSQQLGLVVMDEAFSKLSGDGIDDCLALARDFQLQLVMAFPPERLGVMVPHAQTVMMCLPKTEVRDEKGYISMLANNAVLTTMTEALEALS